MKKIYLFSLSIFFLIAVTSQQSKAQLVVDTAVSVSTMLHDFFDNTCVTISNITYNGAPIAVGFFDASATNLGINAGIMLTSGSVYNAVGPNNSTYTSTENNVDGDADLQTLGGFPTFDACIIEMDIIPSLDTLYFKYVFGSEEYPEWVSSIHSDVFAFYISGPGITGEKNIAVIPGTSWPVSVNNISCYGYNDYYTCNSLDGCPSTISCPDDIDETSIQYDGFTIPMMAQITVIPNSIYHVKLAIADAGDYVYDSGVFIGVESLCGESQLKPVSIFTMLQDTNVVQFQNQSRYATSYTWDFGDNTFSNEANPAHTYAAPGLYNVILTVQNYCCTTSSAQPVAIGIATGFKVVDENFISIFPNPAKDILNVQLSDEKKAILKLYDNSGKELSSSFFEGTITLDVSGYGKGMLFMQLIVDGKVYLKKVELN